MYMRLSTVPATLFANICAAVWFHLWCLPVIWLLAVSLLWGIAMTGAHADAGMLAAVASLAGQWLAYLHPEWHRGLAAALASCVGGMLVMGSVGLFQDLLRVPKQIVLIYFVTAPVLFIFFTMLLGVPHEGGLLVLFEWFLVHFCGGLYVLSVGSCLMYLLLSVRRKLATCRSGLSRRQGEE